MRSKNAVKNLTFYLLYEIVIFVLGIIFPRYIILTYGSEINGLTSTITRILSLINLIQAGAVGAAIYQMYKPVADDDYETQSAIIYTSRKFYNLISMIYFGAALIVGVFYSFYLKNDSLKWIEIFLSFVILALNGGAVLLFNSICDIFLSPHQKKYYLTIGMLLDQIVRYGCLSVVLFFKLHFIFIYLSYLMGGVIDILVQTFFYKKLSKGKITKDPKDKKYKIPNKKYLMFSCIGGEAVTASPTIIITTFIDLIASSVFSIYSMIFTSLKTFLNSIQLSFSAIFGNLVKTSDDNHIYEVYSCIELITIILGTICSACVGFLLLPFIELYTSGVGDANYFYPILAIFVVAWTIVFSFRTSNGYVATVYGLFRYTCNITLIFAALSIIISSICVVCFGMPYVMIGLIFNELGCSIATVIVLKKKVKWFKIKKLLIRTTIMVVLSIGGILAYYSIKPEIASWLMWILCGFTSAGIIIFILCLYCLLFERKYIKMFINYIKNTTKKNA